MTRWEVSIAVLACAVSAVVLILLGREHHWDAGVSLGVAGLAVSIAGFAVAIFALHRAGTKADAAYHAVRETLAGVAASRLTVVITQLRQVIMDLDEAADRGDAVTARRLLNGWRHLGQDAEGLICRRFGEEHQVLALLRRSIRAASKAKGTLFAPDVNLAEAMRPPLAAMEKASDDLGPLLEELLPAMNEDKKHE